MDTVSAKKRSEMMSGVRSENTKPELTIRRKLHVMGFRYRLHAKNMPGTPDLVLPKYNTVIFVNGCFWHQHPGCAKATIPTTRAVWWEEKLNSNVDRDRKIKHELVGMGWNVFTVWECDISKNADKVVALIARDLQEAKLARMTTIQILQVI